VYKKFGEKVMVQEILVAATKRWEDLPILPRVQCKITGKNEMCWNYLCSSCKWGKNCLFARNHVLGKEVDEKFAEDVVKALKPGMDAMMKTSYDRGEYHTRMEAQYCGRPDVGRCIGGTHPVEASREVVKAVAGRAWATAALKKMTEDEAEQFLEKWRDQNSADLAKIEEKEDAEVDLLVMDGKGEYTALRKRARAEQQRGQDKRSVKFKLGPIPA
jgi:hypothetical protein